MNAGFYGIGSVPATAHVALPAADVCPDRPAPGRIPPIPAGLAEDTKGMAGDAAGVCLKPYGVCEDSSPEQAVMNGARRTCPDLAGARSRRLERELFHLWEFVWQEGVGDEAREFVDERKSDETPFEC